MKEANSSQDQGLRNAAEASGCKWDWGGFKGKSLVQINPM